jgi:uncharacterized Zn-binding protein involved in type VI secretion
MFPILTALAQAQCPHGGKVTLAATSSKVLVDNGPVFTQGDQGMIAGCAFTVPPGKPQPCVKGMFTMPSTKVMVEGKPALLKGPADLGQSGEQIPQGPLVYASVQMKVTAL